MADRDQREKKPEVPVQGETQPTREKEIPTHQQSSDEPNVEKAVNRQRRAEVQNPLMHESY